MCGTIFKGQKDVNYIHHKMKSIQNCFCPFLYYFFPFFLNFNFQCTLTHVLSGSEYLYALFESKKLATIYSFLPPLGVGNLIYFTPSMAPVYFFTVLLPYYACTVQIYQHLTLLYPTQDQSFFQEIGSAFLPHPPLRHFEICQAPTLFELSHYAVVISP